MPGYDRQAQLVEELIRGGWDAERAHDAKQVGLASEEVLIDIAAAPRAQSERQASDDVA
jgi:hypothetical protein